MFIIKIKNKPFGGHLKPLACLQHYCFENKEIKVDSEIADNKYPHPI